MSSIRVPGTVIDGWRLNRRLGKGGNGEVWEADRDGTSAALKLLKEEYLNATHKRFIRFRDEALAHRRLAPVHPGLLPLLDHSIPPEPGPDKPAWLATPIAVRVRTALKGRSLAEAVRAVLAVAETLSSLHAEGVSHRDIKPDNLFRLGDRWVIGDLGLVDFPEKDAITDTGERLGPLSYLAPEMLDEAKRADGALVDVYSLAKTLWVLVTEQNTPPGGELRADNPAFGIGAYVTHPRVRQLDLLIERSTKHVPKLRPAMAEFAAELRSWLTAPKVTEQPDLAEVLSRLHAQTEPALYALSLRQREEEQTQAVVVRIRDQLSPLAKAFAATKLSTGEIAEDSSSRERLLGPPTLTERTTRWENGLVIRASGLPQEKWSRS